MTTTKNLYNLYNKIIKIKQKIYNKKPKKYVMQM